MAVNSQTLANYLNLPPDNANELDGFLAAAFSKARSAGIPNYQNNAAYDQFILALAANYYDNRGLTYGGSYQATAEENARRMTNAYVLELRFAGEDVIV